MCTVSIVPHRDGVRVIANRDERRERSTALQPRFLAIGARSVIMPIDPEGGGTWIGVNDAGLVAIALNRHATTLPAACEFVSRGTVAPRALGADTLEGAIASVLALDACAFRPFRLVLLQADRVALIASDSREMAHGTAGLSMPLMFTSSSLGDALVDAPRRRLFDCLVRGAADVLDGQRRFHCHQWSDKREISVLMDRRDAATVSRTTIDVSASEISLEYEPLVVGVRPVTNVRGALTGSDPRQILALQRVAQAC